MSEQIAVEIPSQLAELIEKGFIPDDQSPVDLSRTIEFSKFSELGYEERLAMKDTAIVVCDGATWALPDELDDDGSILPSTSFFSGDGKKIYRHLRRAKFSLCKVSQFGIENTSTITPLYINNKKPELRGDSQMSENQGVPNFEAVGAQLSDELLNTGDAANSAAFQGGAEVTPETSSTDPLVSELRKITESVTLSNGVSVYHGYLYENATILGYYTNNDEHIAPSLKAVVKNRDSIVDNAPQNHKDNFANGNKAKIPYKYFPHYFEINFKHVRPGALLGAAIEAPIEMNEDIISLRDPNFTFSIPEQLNKRKFFFKRQELFGVMVYSFPGGIKEDPRTHPGKTDVIEIIASYTKKKGSDESKESRRLVGRERKHNYIRPTNYLPINTYLTVDISKAQFTADEVEGLNNIFFNLLKDMGQGSKYDMLKAEHKAIFAGSTSNLDVKTKFFAEALGDREPITVESYHSKGQNLETIQVPVKKRNESNKEGVVKYSASYVKINAVSPQVLSGKNANAALSSLNSPKFEQIRAVFGEEGTSVSLLSDIARSTSSTSTQDKTRITRGKDLFKLAISGYTPNVEVDENLLNPKFTQSAIRRNLGL